MSADIKRISGELPVITPIPLAEELAKKSEKDGDHGLAFLIREQDRGRQQNEWLMRKTKEVIENQETLSLNQADLWKEVSELKDVKTFGKGYVKGAGAVIIALSGFFAWLVTTLKGQ